MNAAPTKNLILVSLSQLLPRRFKRNARTSATADDADAPDDTAGEVAATALAA